MESERLAKVWNEYPVVEMGSSGPWYSPVVKAACLLGYQEIKRGNLTWDRLSALVMRDLGHLMKPDRLGPTEQMVRRWHKDTPLFAEDAVRSGRVSRAELPIWAQTTLDVTMDIHKGHSGARMNQQTAPEGGSTGSGSSGWGELGKLLLLLALGQITRAVLGSSNAAQAPLRLGRRRRGIFWEPG